MNTPQERTVLAGDYRVRVLEAGHGGSLLFLHSAAGAGVWRGREIRFPASKMGTHRARWSPAAQGDANTNLVVERPRHTPRTRRHDAYRPRPRGARRRDDIARHSR